jgi:cell division transport system permease protein
MQLVGATRSFIRKPFVSKSVVQGLIGALLANIALLGVFSSFNSGFSEIVSYGTTEVTIAVFGLVFIFGALISWLSTRFAVNKFLRLRYDELFN